MSAHIKIKKNLATVVLVMFVPFITINKGMAANPTAQPPQPTIANTSPVSAESAKPKQATINKILVSDKVDSEGYVSESNLTIPADVPHIYVTVQVNNSVPPNTTVNANLTGPGLKVAGSGNLTQSGLVLKSFDFSRSKPWVPGDYEVTVSLSNSDQQTVKFTVKK
jgi:hypothetical protein